MNEQDSVRKWTAVHHVCDICIIQMISMQAVYNFDMSTLQYLLFIAQADANVSDDIGLTPVHIAAKYGNIQALALLYLCGGDVNLLVNVPYKCTMTPLMCAASTSSNASLSIISFLLECGADVLLQDRDGNTAVDYAKTYDVSRCMCHVSGNLLD